MNTGSDSGLLVVILLLITISLAYSIVAYQRSRELAKIVGRLEGLIASSMENVETLASLSKKAKKKPRKRYIVFRLLSQEPIGHGDVENAIKTAISRLYGDYGLSLSRMYLAIYEPSTGYGVLRVSHLWKDKVIIALSYVRNIEDKPVLIIPIRISGSIKRAREVILGKRGRG